MDRYTRVGFMLFAGLAITAGLIVVLVLFANLRWWLGLLLLAVADTAEILWAYTALKRPETSDG